MGGVVMDGVTDESGLTFDVLGPLEVRRGDCQLSLGRVQQRIVLALLLLRAGRRFPRDRLIDAVWGEPAPKYAVNLLQKQVSLLRRVLDPGPMPSDRSAVLEWTDSGYLLRVPPLSVDLHRFDLLVRSAGEARQNGDGATAWRKLNEALGLWRGALCEGLDNPVLELERERLAEKRLTVIEDRVDVGLALGHHHDLVHELRGLVSEHPTRERLRAALMLALHRSGDTADALAAYRETRRFISMELGLEPSVDVQRLHQRILDGDAGLLSSSDSRPPSWETQPSRSRSQAGEAVDSPSVEAPAIQVRPMVAPAQLPHGIADFTGRAAELSHLHSELQRYPRSATMIVSIVGSAGVGKTALAVEWARQVAHQFADGQLYLDLRGYGSGGNPMEPVEAIEGFLAAFGVDSRQSPATVPAQAALYRSLVAHRRILVVLDNACDVDQVRPLLPGSGGCLVIVTSRDDLSGLVATDGAVPVPLGLLAIDEARDLLRHRIGDERTAREPAALEDLALLCACLPLALAIVAARAVTRPDFTLSALTEELRDLDDGLDAFDGGDASSDIRRVLSWSYARLSPPAARLFRCLGLAASPEISLAATCALADLPPVRARKALGELARAHLVNELAPGRYSFHALLRAYAVELGDAEDDLAAREAARARMLGHFVRTALAADRLLNPVRFPSLWLDVAPAADVHPLTDSAGALAWFTQECPSLLAEARRAHESRLDVTTYQLAWGLYTYLMRMGRWHEAETTQWAARYAAQRLGDSRGVAYAELGIACACTWRQDHISAKQHFSAALEFFSGLGDQTGCAQTHRSIGWALERQGLFETALAETEAALSLFRVAGPKAQLAEALNAVGWFRAQLGAPADGLGPCLEALDLHEQLGHREGAAHTWDSLGLVRHRMGDLPEAIRCYTMAIDLWREIADHYYEAASLTRRGDAHLAGGEAELARSDWSLASALFDELGYAPAPGIRERLEVAH